MLKFDHMHYIHYCIRQEMETCFGPKHSDHRKVNRSQQTKKLIGLVFTENVCKKMQRVSIVIFI
jgi:hypothetical protein